MVSIVFDVQDLCVFFLTWKRKRKFCECETKTIGFTRNVNNFQKNTLPKFNSSPLKSYLPNRKGLSSKHHLLNLGGLQR